MPGEAKRRRLRALLARAGVPSADLPLVEAALIHQSAVHEGRAAASNERLEFFGDAILGMIVAKYLYERYPDADEGELTLRKAALVKDAALAATAERLELGPLMTLGGGLASAPAAQRRTLLADAVEAVIAALFVEAGFEKTAAFVEREHVAVIERDQVSLDDPKTVLQEWTQRRHGTTPEYRERAEGSPKDRTFHASVAIAGETLAAGSGRSKKEAQRAAAERALETLRERYGDLPPRRLSARAPRDRKRGAA
ncbi:MAG: ribonuclease III [Candidatus Eremiobacteraeota bacterium]|nr:ribonuclease III [Candidatus Eremiobacteraeota bacterium]